MRIQRLVLFVGVYFTAGDTSFLQAKVIVRMCPSSGMSAKFVHSLVCSFAHSFIHSFMYSWTIYCMPVLSCSAILGAGPILMN